MIKNNKNYTIKEIHALNLFTNTTLNSLQILLTRHIKRGTLTATKGKSVNNGTKYLIKGADLKQFINTNVLNVFK